MESEHEIKLHVQLIAYGQDGVDRVAAHQHPHVPGVRWLVSVQSPDTEVTIPVTLSNREDFDIIVHKDRGAAKNRNHALDFDCNSELILLGDDDVDYNAESLVRLINAFAEHPDADIICCQYTSGGKFIKPYGSGEFSLSKPPFGWYPSGVEISFRRKIAANFKFNEKIGPGSGGLISGDDTVGFYDLLRKSRGGYCVHIAICEHAEETMSARLKLKPEFLKAHGAIMTHIKPYTWFPRLILHAHRTPIPFFRCLRHTLNGVLYAYRHRIFR